MDVKTARIQCNNCVYEFPLPPVPNSISRNITNNMQTYLDVNDDHCPLYYFDSSYKTLLGACLIVFGVFGVLLNGWLFATFVHSHLLISRSHILLLNVCSASLGRNLLGFPFAAASAIANRWLFGPLSCQLFAFLNQFYGVLQMTALFAIVLERYLLARNTRRERTVYYRYYWTLIAVSWANAVVFAVPPLFGYGVYACDATGTICTLLWPSAQAGARHLGYAVPYVIVCAVAPVVGIFFYMGKANRLECIYYRNETLKEEKHLTKCIHAVCVITLALWIPAALQAGSQWFPLLIYGSRPHVPPILALIAPITSEVLASVDDDICYNYYVVATIEMSRSSCDWDPLFTDEDVAVLKNGLVLTDSASVILGLWLNLALLFTNLNCDLGYRNLAFFTVITCLRRALPLCNYLLLSENWLPLSDSCAFNGFWNTFLSVYEVECLTHVCIERYVVAKYINNGWSIIRWHYTMYQGLCLLFAALYSLPPFFGIGDYALDFTCTSCTFSMNIPNTWQRYVIVTIFLLRSLKSASFMIVMLYWACQLEMKNKSSKKMMEQAPFNKSATAITAVNLACWLPLTMLRGGIIFSQFIYGSTVIPTVFQVQWAIWLSSISPALTAVTLFMSDKRIRCELVDFWKAAHVKQNKKDN